MKKSKWTQEQWEGDMIATKNPLSKEEQEIYSEYMRTGDYEKYLADLKKLKSQK
jgi:hypothetical protein